MTGLLHVPKLAGQKLLAFIRLICRCLNAWRNRYASRSPWWLIAILILAICLSPVWARLFWRTGSAAFSIFAELADQRDNPDMLRWYALAAVGMITALGGLLAAPLSIIRVYTTERQTRATEEGLITDRINKAVEGLSAEKEVNRLGRNVAWRDGAGRLHSDFEWKGKPALPEGATLDPALTGDWTNITLTEPNMEVRLGAIYALERIAQDSDRDHIRVMEILCAYIRENAPASQAIENPLGDWPNYPTNPTAENLEERGRSLVTRPERHKNWLENLKRRDLPPSDIQTALTVIGRRTDRQRAIEQKDPTNYYRIDIRSTNLQAANFQKLDLSNAQMSRSRLEGVNLSGAVLSGADLTKSKLNGAILSGTFFNDAKLTETSLEAAAHPMSTDVVASASELISRTFLRNANLTNACFCMTSLSLLDFTGSKMFGVGFECARISHVDLTKTKLINAKFDGSAIRDVTLHSNDYKTHYLTKVDFAGASMGFTRFQNTDLIAAETSVGDLGNILRRSFGDGSVKLPEGLRAGEPPLEHWSPEILDFEAFDRYFNAFVQKLREGEDG